MLHRIGFSTRGYGIPVITVDAGASVALNPSAEPDSADDWLCAVSDALGDFAIKGVITEGDCVILPACEWDGFEIPGQLWRIEEDSISEPQQIRVIQRIDTEDGTNVGIIGYPDSYPILTAEKAVDTDFHRRWLADPKHDTEDRISYICSMIYNGLSDLKIFGEPFQPNDVLQLRSSEWFGTTMPEVFWQVEDDFIEPIPLRLE